MEQQQTYAERAKALFLDGYNCAQAVLCAFEDVTRLPRETALRLASGFGGGMGRLREVCGAVSGAVMTLSLVCGYNDPKDTQAKAAHYALVQEFARRFRQETGSIVCRELLQGVPTTQSPVPEARTPDYYRKRPCADLVALAAGIAEDLLAQK